MKKKTNNLPEKSHHLYKEEAMLMAKSIQRPNQTKEQTRLIAQGVEKGIALYKKQHAEKQRELDKQQKKKGRLTSLNQANQTEQNGAIIHPVIYPLYTAGGVFLGLAIATLIALFYEIDNYFSNPSIAVGILLFTSVIFAGLAMWMFKSALADKYC